MIKIAALDDQDSGSICRYPDQRAGCRPAAGKPCWSQNGMSDGSYTPVHSHCHHSTVLPLYCHHTKAYYHHTSVLPSHYHHTNILPSHKRTAITIVHYLYIAFTLPSHCHHTNVLPTHCHHTAIEPSPVFSDSSNFHYFP